VEATQKDSLLNDKASTPQWWRVKLKDGRIITNTTLPCGVRKTRDGLAFT
jgi:hypothetical protein